MRTAATAGGTGTAARESATCKSVRFQEERRCWWRRVDGDEGGRTSVSRSCSLAASRRNMDTASRHSCGSKRIRGEKWQGTRRGRRLRRDTLISSGVHDSDAAAAERALRVTGLPRPEQRARCEGVGGQGVVQRQAYRRWTCGRTLRQFPR